MAHAGLFVVRTVARGCAHGFVKVTIAGQAASFYVAEMIELIPLAPSYVVCTLQVFHNKLQWFKDDVVVVDESKPPQPKSRQSMGSAATQAQKHRTTEQLAGQAEQSFYP